ncbi:MAG: PDC sensor domain-containing protein [Candidatus Omnitrophota bacterium]|nr:PDC sensor domain-containing protein [Candidatus Omnitrophota bacterium]MBU2035005.1 PDC sensor domain-containing protein [Candidatus Omnitrophota bacterium]MBU2221358.1 PDC sensor domain-containing protein [Candidatus Omnitrophota bacterium]MBU2257579.1 PDC sensor domain-containing protein [Candidatus Omnitrophota bacterium]
MKKSRWAGLMLCCALLLTAVLDVCYAQAKKELTPAGQALFDKEVATVQSWGKDPKIVSYVKAKNASGETLDQVKERDKAWITTSGIDAFMKGILDNDCSKYLLELRKSTPAVGEFFLMDINGAIVGETNKTSDYWQGDEDKHIKTCQVGGSGATFIDKSKYDESSQKFSRQVSVPVIDPDTGKVIGAITVGVDLDKLIRLSQ